MKRVTQFIALFLPCLVLVSSCKKGPDDPQLPDGTDTTVVTTDYRARFTGLFDIHSVYQESGMSDVTYDFTDSIKLYNPGELQIPVEPGSYGNPRVDSTGHLTRGATENIYWNTDGSFFTQDSLNYYLHMDQTPHTFSWRVTARRH